jgi:hypothetical protein
MVENLTRQPLVVGGVDDVHAAAQHREGSPAGPHRRRVGSAVDAAGQAGNDGHPRLGQTSCDARRDLPPVARRTPCSDDRHGQVIIRGQRASYIENGRGCRDQLQQPRVGWVGKRQNFDARPFDALHLGVERQSTTRLYHALG